MEEHHEEEKIKPLKNLKDEIEEVVNMLKKLQNHRQRCEEVPYNRKTFREINDSVLRTSRDLHGLIGRILSQIEKEKISGKEIPSSIESRAKSYSSKYKQECEAIFKIMDSKKKLSETILEEEKKKEKKTKKYIVGGIGVGLIAGTLIGGPIGGLAGPIFFSGVTTLTSTVVGGVGGGLLGSTIGSTVGKAVLKANVKESVKKDQMSSPEKDFETTDQSGDFDNDLEDLLRKSRWEKEKRKREEEEKKKMEKEEDDENDLIRVIEKPPKKKEEPYSKWKIVNWFHSKFFKKRKK